MDSYAIARAESRIQDLESEIRRLKHDMEMSRSNERSERSRSESDIYFWLWMLLCGEIRCSFLLSLPPGRADFSTSAPDMPYTPTLSRTDNPPNPKCLEGLPWESSTLFTMRS